MGGVPKRDFGGLSVSDTKEISYAVLLVIALQTSLIQVHTNEVDTPNKFAIVLYLDVEVKLSLVDDLE